MEWRKYGTKFTNFETYFQSSQTLLEIIKSKKKISVANNADWNALFDLAAYHRVGYVVMDKVKNIPSIYEHRLKLFDFAVRKKNKKYDDLLRKISNDFSREKIKFVPLKGVTRLRQTNFRRPMVDIDLWVAERDISKAGFVLGKYMAVEKKKDAFGRGVELIAQRDGLIVEIKDIHKHINMQIDRFLNSSRQKEILFCFEASHAIMNHAYERIGWFYDGYQDLQNGMDLKKVLSAAKDTDTLKAVKTYILALNILFESEFNSSELKAEDRKMAEQFLRLHNPVLPLECLDVHIIRTMMQVSCARSNERFAYLWKSIFKSKEEIKKRKARFGYALYILKHPFFPKLIWNYVFPKGFQKWLAKKTNETNLQDSFIYMKYMDMIPEEEYSEDEKAPKILVVYNEPPVPIQGGNIRVFNLINQIRKKYRVTLLILPKQKNDADVKKLKKDFPEIKIVVAKIFFSEMLKLPIRQMISWIANRYFFLRLKKMFSNASNLTKGHLQQNYCLNRELREILKKEDFDYIQIEHFYLSQSIRGIKTSAIKIIDLHNVHSAMLPFGKKRSQIEREEILASKNFDASIVCSEKDAQHAHNLGFDNIQVVPNGVDVDYFKFEKINKPDKLVFVGDFSYKPNKDGILWFIKKILPFVPENMDVHIMGRNSDKIRNNRIKSFGYVDDIRPHLKNAVFFCPIREGGGTRLKILSAASSGAPIISTTKGVEGLDFISGKEILIADTPYEFIKALSEIKKEKQREVIRINARKKAEQYSWNLIGKDYLEFLSKNQGASRKKFPNKQSVKERVSLAINKAAGLSGRILRKISPALYRKIKKIVIRK